MEHDAQSLLSDCTLLKSTFDCMYSSVTNPIAKIKNLVRNAEGAYVGSLFFDALQLILVLGASGIVKKRSSFRSALHKG